MFSKTIKLAKAVAPEMNVIKKPVEIPEKILPISTILKMDLNEIYSNKSTIWNKANMSDERKCAIEHKIQEFLTKSNEIGYKSTLFRFIDEFMLVHYNNDLVAKIINSINVVPIDNKTTEAVILLTFQYYASSLGFLSNYTKSTSFNKDPNSKIIIEKISLLLREFYCFLTSKNAPQIIKCFGKLILALLNVRLNDYWNTCNVVLKEALKTIEKQYTPALAGDQVYVILQAINACAKRSKKSDILLKQNQAIHYYAVAACKKIALPLLDNLESVPENKKIQLINYVLSEKGILDEIEGKYYEKAINCLLSRDLDKLHDKDAILLGNILTTTSIFKNYIQLSTTYLQYFKRLYQRISSVEEDSEFKDTFFRRTNTILLITNTPLI